MEKNFLQSIKLEISRNFKLVPYERMAFHKILGILKTDVGMEILRKELDKGPDIRESAISVLASFPQPLITGYIVRFLSGAITENEKMVILEHLELHGSQDEIETVIGFIESMDAGTESRHVITKAFHVLRTMGADSSQAMDYLFSKIDSDETASFMRCQGHPFPLGILRHIQIRGSAEKQR